MLLFEIQVATQTYQAESCKMLTICLDGPSYGNTSAVSGEELWNDSYITKMRNRSYARLSKKNQADTNSTLTDPVTKK